MPIRRSAVLCGSRSGDLVPDLHGSVPESGDIEILDTHVSYCDRQPNPWVAIPVIKATQRSSGRRIRNILFSNSRASINLKQFTMPINYRHTLGNHASIQATQAIMQSCNITSNCINNAVKETQ